MASRAVRLVYVLINSPVGSKPYVDKIFKANPFITAMYTANKGECLSKRDLERLRVRFPCGPRYQLLPYELPLDFFSRNNEPAGPDIIDRAHQEYIEQLKAKPTPLA